MEVYNGNVLVGTSSGSKLVLAPGVDTLSLDFTVKVEADEGWKMIRLVDADRICNPATSR